MNKIRVIDLYNRIANGQVVPKKIKYHDVIYKFDKGDYFGGDADEYYNDALLLPHIVEVKKFLNEEVEIIEDTPKEDKKIEKIDISNFPKRNNSLKKTALKVNEIIDKINGA